MAAAIGIALTLTGAVGWLSSRLPAPRWRTSSFCISLALLAVTGVMVNATLGAF
jgi:hypothetical protein